MTEQEPDYIIDQANHFEITGTPLEQYFSIYSRPSMVIHKTSNRRGYIASWLVDENKLFLIDLKPDPIENSGFTMAEIFKKLTPVLADWFSGKFFINKGKRIGYEGFTPLYDE